MPGKKINVSVIGCGGRARSVVGNLLRDSKNKVNIVSVYDPRAENAGEALEIWHAPEARLAADALEAINDHAVEWVMIFSPNAMHKEHILAAFNAGKHVFSEKPLATTIEDCQAIYEAHEASNCIFATGFVLRYAPIYRQAKKMLASGRLGKIISVEGNENIAPAHGGYIATNWRRFIKLAGPHILEKCCHDLDLLIWFCNSLPSRVAAFGGRNFFIPENRYLEKKYGKKTFMSWWDPERAETPFSEEMELMDNICATAEFRNGIRANFSATMSNAIPERRIRFNCSEGTMTIELYTMELHYKLLGDQEERVIKYPTDGHAGGDNYISKALYKTMCDHGEPECSGKEGLESAVFALSLDAAAREGRVLDLEKIWSAMKR